MQLRVSTTTPNACVITHTYEDIRVVWGQSQDFDIFAGILYHGSDHHGCLSRGDDVSS